MSFWLLNDIAHINGLLSGYTLPYFQLKHVTSQMLNAF